MGTNLQLHEHTCPAFPTLHLFTEISHATNNTGKYGTVHEKTVLVFKTS